MGDKSRSVRPKENYLQQTIRLLFTEALWAQWKGGCQEAIVNWDKGVSVEENII